MRKVFLALLTFFLISPAMANVQPTITVENISERPASPGETVKMFIVVGNEGSSDASFDPIDVETVEGIEFRGTTSDFSDSFKVCAGCQKVGTLYFKVREGTSSGEYPVDITVSSGESGVVGKFDLSVDGSPKLVLDAGNFTVSPGEKSTAAFTLSNIGTDNATQTTLQLSTEMFGLNPSTIRFGTVEPGSSVRKEAEVSADKNVGSGLKTLSMNLNYRDGNKEVSKATSIYTEVEEKAKIALSDFELETRKIGKRSSMTVQIENLGPGEAERIVSELQCDSADVLSGKSFVGQLEDEESVPAVFEIRPTGKNVKCDVSISFTDSKERNITESFNFSAQKQSSPLVPVLTLLIAAGGTLYYWRKKREDELEEI